MDTKTIILSALGLYLLIVNIVAFAMYGADKRKAEKHQWRTTEKALFLIAIVGGSIGALLGMKFFRHKTKHLSFQIGIPAILIVHLLCAGALAWYFFIK